jgi:L,D-peptidoglycan transpeptidase YkuD (ErfK/YbiS/YcfS/YnhG family)
MNRHTTTSLLIALLSLPLAGGASAQERQDCPAAAATAERLILVLGSGLKAETAKVQRFEKQGERWRAADGRPKSASLGKNGMAWSWASKAYGLAGEPAKTEGDKRTPAGFFPIGKPFGFTPRDVPGYVTLRAGQHYCVDAPHSPYYNSVVPKASAGDASGEDMAAIPLYRQGLFVDYPANREAKGGSCIFVHVWRKKNAGTAGCVALAERDVMDMQRWSQAKPTVIGILPRGVWEKLRSCFPGL